MEEEEDYAGTRLAIREYVDHYPKVTIQRLFTSSTKIDALLEWIIEKKKRGCTHIEFTAKDYLDNDRKITIKADPFIERYETKEEYNHRKEQEKLNEEMKQAEKDALDKEQYLLLKQKFEK